jgi:hypothetical protein
VVDESASAPPDWSKVEIDVAERVLQQSELYLKAQLEIALASDRRAMTVGAVFSTIATGLVTWSVAQYYQYEFAPILATGLAAALCMSFAAYFSFSASWPTEFEIVGNHPKLWWPHVALPLQVLVGKESENYQIRIGNNNLRLDTNAKRLRRGARFALTAPFVALVIWCVSLYLFPS